MPKQVALVTGASSGIGQAVAAMLAQNGYRVFGTARRPAEVKWAKSVTPVALDVGSEESVARCVDEVVSAVQRIDLLVNNAGVTIEGALEETSIAEARAIFETNVFGVMRMAQAVLPGMREQRAGRVITIGSVGGFVPMPYAGVYAASKHALEGWSETLDHEIRRFGLRAVLVEPTFIRTPIQERAARAVVSLEAYRDERERAAEVMRTQIAKGDDPEAVAKVVLKAATSARPKVRYQAGRGAKTMRNVRSYLPARVFDNGLRRLFRLGRAANVGRG